jgi:hypothetical protein
MGGCLSLRCRTVLLGMLRLSGQGCGQRQRDCQHRPGHPRHPEFEFARHTVLLPACGWRSAITYSLRTLLIRIDIRLYLQIVEQIKIRVQIFVLIERLQIAHRRSHYRHRRRTSFAGDF